MSVISVQNLILIAQKLWMKLIIQTCHPVAANSRNISEFKKAVILTFFILSKNAIYSMSVSSVQSFKLIVQKLWKKLTIQFRHPVVAISRQFSKLEKSVILSNYFPSQNDRCAYTICLDFLCHV